MHQHIKWKFFHEKSLNIMICIFEINLRALLVETAIATYYHDDQKSYHGKKFEPGR